MFNRPRGGNGAIMTGIMRAAADIAARTGETPAAVAASLANLSDKQRRTAYGLLAVLKQTERLEAKMRALGIPELPGGGYPLL